MYRALLKKHLNSMTLALRQNIILLPEWLSCRTNSPTIPLWKRPAGNAPDKNAITYCLAVNYYSGEIAEGIPYRTEEKLYKQSIRYTKQDGLWSYDENYELPEVPGGTGPKPGYTDRVWRMNGKELTADSTVTSDTVTLTAASWRSLK